MPITIDVKPDLSRFREATFDDLVAVLRELVSAYDADKTPVFSQAKAGAAAHLLLKHFVILPR